MWHPCPDCAKCLTPGRLYDPSACTPCQTFLEDMQQDPSASSLASRTWMKWNRTMVNRWKKNNVALYSPTDVRMLIWADSTLFHTYKAVLPPAPPPRSASKDSLCSVGLPEASPVPPVDTLLEQDRSSPWSGFEEVLPPNQEARPRSPTVPHTEPTLPLSPAIPPSQHAQSQPPSDPMMAMFRSLMSSFQSEIKTLRHDLSGSMSTMVAAHLPQVPYQFQTKNFVHVSFYCSYVAYMLPLQLLYSSVLPLQLLYSKDHSTFTRSLLYVFVSHLRQTTPEPPAPVLPMAPSLSVPPSPLVPLDEPQPGPSGLHHPVVLVSVHVDNSVFPRSFCLFYPPWPVIILLHICAIYSICLIYSVFWVRWYISVFHFPHSIGGQKGCGQCNGAGGPQEKGPTSLSTQPTITQTAPTGRSPTSGRTSEYVLGMHFLVSFLVHYPHVFLFIVHYRIY